MKRVPSNARRWVAGVVLLIWPFALPAQPAEKTDKLPLWKVEGKNNTVHLLGSIHFLKKDFYPLPDPIETAYKDSDIVLFETDFAAMKEPAQQVKFALEGMCGPNSSIAEFITTRTHDRLRQHARKLTGQPNALDQFKPWMAALTLVVLELQNLGFNPEHGVDQHYYERARKDGKKIDAFETVEFQMKLFTGMKPADQELLLEQTLDDIAQFSDIFNEITLAWKRGDVGGLEKLVLDTMRDYPKIHAKLLVDRNKAWVPKLKELLDGDQDAFVVVGAAHLVGEDSVVDLLRKNGKKVEQITGGATP